MSTCTIIIKIKDYFPKLDTIPYQNFICLFTNGESEGQIPLISKDTETYKHQIKNIISDVKYKIHVLDYNDMSLIGMCEMMISYDIISQISPPNGFIQEQQKRLLMDTNTKRKLFGTVINMGDIYLNIYSEIYLCENSSNITDNKINAKNLNPKKKLGSGIGVGFGSKKRLEGSPRTVHKKKLMMQINSDRRALININKNVNVNGYLNMSNLDKKNKFKNFSSNGKEDKNITTFINNAKPNSSFNYRDIISKENKNNNLKKSNNINNNSNAYKKINNNIIKKKENTQKNNKQNQIIDKNYSSNNNKENNLSNNNLISRYKTESNKIGANYNNQNLNIYKKMQKPKKNNINQINNKIPQSKNLLINNFSPKDKKENNLSENEEINFNNNTGNKITTIESLENIDFSGKKYITKAKTKKNNSQTAFGNNTLFSTTSTEQEFSDMDKIILEKGTEIRNNFNIQLKNAKNNNNKIFLNNLNINNNNSVNNNTNSSNNNLSNSLDNDNIIVRTQNEIKNNFIKLIDFYSLLSHKLFKINDKNNSYNQKNIIYKEKLFNELKKNNALTQNKTLAEVENFIYINNHGALNEKFLRPVIKMKKSEFKIFQNIFNLFYYEYDILKFKEFEKNKKMDENVKIELLLMVYKNLIKNYGNISQIYIKNETKKNLLKNCLNKYGIVEVIEGEGVDIGQNLDNLHKNMKNKDIINNIKDIKNNLDNKDNDKNDLDKFKVIKEVDEEKEEEFDEEDIKLNEGRMSNNQYQISSNNNSNTKENINLISNEKLKSNHKNLINKSKSAQKKLFDNNEDLIINRTNNDNNKEKLEEIKYNLSEKLITDENKKIENDNDNDNDNNKEDEDELGKINNNNNGGDINKDNIKEKEENNIINIDNSFHKKYIDNNENNNEYMDKNENNEKNANINDNIEVIIEEKEQNFELNKEDKKEKEDDKIIQKNQEKNGENSDLQEIETEIPSVKKEIYTRKNKTNNYQIKDPLKDHKETYYSKKNRIRKEKEAYDEEDIIMQKLLIEDFPKKCKEENRFIRISKYEYSFGEEKIKVMYKEGDVILKLDEGDYKLQEFIEILNEGKNEEENLENNEDINDNNENDLYKEVNENNNNDNNNKIEIQVQEEIIKDENITDNENFDKHDENLSDNNKDKNINNNSYLSSGNNHKKRRKKRVSEENSIEKGYREEEKEKEKENIIKEEIKGKEIELNNNNINYNSDMSDINKISNTDESDINSENKGRKYHIKRRRDYKEKKLK